MQQSRNGLTLGETSIFTRGKLNSRFSLLSEHTLLPRYYREDQFKLERLVLHYEINESHWCEFGKLHTPVNYWNDWYHHGRLFFPTIDRPAFFSDNFFPIHEIGLRVGGLVGYKSLQYDLLVGSGSVAVPGDDGDQIFPNGIQSFNAALIYPWENWTFRSGLYLDGIRNATPLLRLHTVSIHMEGHRIQSLLEFAAKFCEEGLAVPEQRKYALYQHIGYKLSGTMMPYIALDFISSNRIQVIESTNIGFVA